VDVHDEIERAESIAFIFGRRLRSVPLPPVSPGSGVDDDREHEHAARNHVFDGRVEIQQIHAVRNRADQKTAEQSRPWSLPAVASSPLRK